MPTQPGCPDPKCENGICYQGIHGEYLCPHPSHKSEPTVNEGPYPTQTGNATVDNVNRVRNEAFREGVASCQEKIKAAEDRADGMERALERCRRFGTALASKGLIDCVDDALKTFGKGGAK